MNEPTTFAKAGSAVFYGVSSIMIVFVNKILLTNYKFPSFYGLALGQMLATIVILFIASQIGIISIPKMDRTTPRKIFPLPLFYVLNLVSGLGGTQKLNLPMFTVLRRFSIFMTMLLEFFILKVQPPFAVKFSVFLMIFGSFIAAVYDLTFDAYGYTLIFINDIATAANGVYMKKKLDAKDLGQYGLMYYNALFMLLPAMTLTYFTDDAEKVRQYIDEGNLTVGVLLCFLLSCVCGFILNYSIILCTHYNSALTTTCVGPIKNLFVTYVGMISSGDYVFQWANFVGVNISVFGSIVYTYATFRKASPINKARQVTVKPVERRPLLDP